MENSSLHSAKSVQILKNENYTWRVRPSLNFPFRNDFDNSKEPATFTILTDHQKMLVAKITTLYTYIMCFGEMEQDFEIRDKEQISSESNLVTRTHSVLLGEVHDNLNYDDMGSKIEVFSQSGQEIGSYEFKAAETILDDRENNNDNKNISNDVEVDIRVSDLERKVDILRYKVCGTARVGILEQMWEPTEAELRSLNGTNVKYKNYKSNAPSREELRELEISPPVSREGFHDTSNTSLHTDYYKLVIYNINQSPSLETPEALETKMKGGESLADQPKANGRKFSLKSPVGSILFKRLRTGGKVIRVEFPAGATVIDKLLLIQTSLALERRVNFLLVYQNITLHWIMWRMLPGVVLLIVLVYLAPHLLK